MWRVGIRTPVGRSRGRTRCPLYYASTSVLKDDIELVLVVDVVSKLAHCADLVEQVVRKSSWRGGCLDRRSRPSPERVPKEPTLERLPGERSAAEGRRCLSTAMVNRHSHVCVCV